MGSIRPTADVQPAPIIAMRTITLLLLAGLIAAVTTAPIPSPDAHHGGPHLEDEGLTWVSEARMKSNKPMMHQKSGHHNMSRKKANMRKQEGVMMKKSNMNNKNNKNKMKSNNKRRKNSNMNKRKQQTAAYKAKPAEQQQPMSFAERLMAMRQQQRKEQDAQRKRERDEYLAILKETGEIEEDADVIKYGAASTEYNPFKEEKREQQKLLKQQSVALPPETPPGPGSGLMLQEDDYNPFDVGYLSTVFDSAKQMFGI